MQLSADRLLDRLGSHGLDPCYFLYGDEPLQLSECGDALRRRAHDDGIAERRVFDVETASDWDAVAAASSAMSLFAERRLLEIRLGKRKPDKRGQAVLDTLIGAPQAEDVVLIVAGKLDAAARKTKWFKALEKNTVCVTARDLEARQLPAWLKRRAAASGKILSDEAQTLIADRVEGNLLAAAQELEKLCLLVAEETIDARAVISAVTDSARFDVYQFVDAALGRELSRAMRIARGLREEGTEPVLVVWALGRELRQLTAMAALCAKGSSVSAAMDQYRVWGNRKRIIGSVLERYSHAQLLTLLTYSNYIDTVVKGGRSGAPWDEIEILVLCLCGARGVRTMVPAY